MPIALRILAFLSAVGSLFYYAAQRSKKEVTEVAALCKNGGQTLRRSYANRDCIQLVHSLSLVRSFDFHFKSK